MMKIQGDNITPSSSGLYIVSSRTMLYGPVGMTKKIKNPNRKWFEVWKPKTIISPVVMPVEIYSSVVTKQLEAFVEYNREELTK